MEDIITQLIALRHKKGLSQRDLAELSKVPSVTIARMETRKFQPNLATLEKLLFVLRAKTEIVEKDIGIACKLNVMDGKICLPHGILKQLGIKKGKSACLFVQEQRDSLYLRKEAGQNTQPLEVLPGGKIVLPQDFQRETQIIMVIA